MEQNIKKLHSTILICVDEVIRICNKHDIPYFIYAGSLLGAVRHKGFIPWDDDFDFAMKRFDYEQFCKVCKNEINSQRFILQTEVSEEYYAFSFAKLRLCGTKLIEPFSEGVDISDGIFVDIFPMDNLPNNKLVRKAFMILSHVIKNMIWIKCGYGVYTHSSKLSYKILKILGRPLSLKTLKKHRHSLITKYNLQQTKECFNSDWPKYVIQNEFFKERDTYEFEGRKLDSFKYSDLFLTSIYGDYMTPPPEDERRWHNEGFDLGIYG